MVVRKRRRALYWLSTQLNLIWIIPHSPNLTSHSVSADMNLEKKHLLSGQPSSASALKVHNVCSFRALQLYNFFCMTSCCFVKLGTIMIVSITWFTWKASWKVSCELHVGKAMAYSVLVYMYISDFHFRPCSFHPVTIINLCYFITLTDCHVYVIFAYF